MKTETVGLEPLAIVGLGCLFPKAHSPGAYWANIKHGVDGITAVPPTHWNPDDYFDTDPKKPDFTYAQRGVSSKPTTSIRWNSVSPHVTLRPRIPRNSWVWLPRNKR